MGREIVRNEKNQGRKGSRRGQFECLKAASKKCEWLGVRITFRIWFFGDFRVLMLIFLIFRAKAYTCWSARFARSRVGGVARLLKGDFGFFFGFFLLNFDFLSFFSIFESLAASKIEQVA